MRAAIYIRVSTQEQADEGFSLAAQERVCREWCLQHNHSVMRVYVEEGKSAATMQKRLVLQEMLEDGKQKSFDLIVIHKLDRISRNTRDALSLFSQLEGMGISIASITEAMDFSTPSGKMLLTLLVSFSQFFLDNLGAELKKGNLEKARQGYYHGKRSPYGYKIIDGKLVLDETEAEIVKQVYKLWNTGIYSYTTLSEHLSEQNISLLPHVIGRILHNPVYYGDIVLSTLPNYKANKWHDRDIKTFPGKHTPIIEKSEYQIAQQVLSEHRKSGKGMHKKSASYQYGNRLLYCRCGNTMQIVKNQLDVTYYRCSAKRKGFKCDSKFIREETMDDLISQLISKITLPGEWQEQIMRNVISGASVDVYANRRRELLAKRERLADLYFNGRKTKEQYWDQDKEIEEQLKQMPIVEVSSEDAQQARQILTDLPDLWAKASRQRQKDLLHLMFKEIHLDANQKQIIKIKPNPSFAVLFNVTDGFIVF